VFEPTQRFGHWDGYLRSSAWPLVGSHRRPRIGLVWAAGRKLDDPFTAREYRKRSLPPEALAALIEGLHGQGAELSNLQIGPDRDQAKPWADLFVDALPAHADFADTAAWIRQLDLLISVDTASAHLAGALGHPCWMLLPYSADPRWLRDRSDSPWYPSLRLFRQPDTGQWQPVIEQVLTAFTPWWRQASS
jgi:ADP-heptose:LPS heptosyltransferase